MSTNSIRATGWAQTFPVADGVRASRHWTRTHLDTLGWNQWAPDVADAVELTVSELVTNAHLHAHSAAQLVMTWDNHYLYVSVHDASHHLPAAPTPEDPDDTSENPDDDLALGGRGIILVDALTDAWGIQRQAAGKTITAVFRGPIALHCDPPCPPTSGRKCP